MLIWYYVPMRAKRDCWVCEECGWAWLVTGTKMPERCPSRKCRKTTWNSIGREMATTIRETVVAKMAGPAKAELTYDMEV